MFKKIRFVFLVIVIQVLISIPIRNYYLSDSNGDVNSFNIFILAISISFILFSVFISYRLNKSLFSNFNGITIAFISLIPFLMLLIIANGTNNIINKEIVYKVLSYSFLHLGGFRQIIYDMLGFKAVYNLFFSMNITIFIHCIGFFIGDIIYLLRCKKHVKL